MLVETNPEHQHLAFTQRQLVIDAVDLKMPFQSEYKVLEQLLRDVHENEVEISRNRCQKEARDIKDAVNDVTEEFLLKVFENDKIFHIPRTEIASHLLLVGGVAEESKINDLDEFDYTFIFPHFDSRTIEVLGRENKRVINSSPFRQIRYKGPKAIKRKLLKRCILAKINSDVYLSALDVRSFFESRVRKGLRKFFILEMLGVVKSTGNLTLNESFYEIHGPALTLYFRWKNNDDIRFNRKGLLISVDITITIMSKDNSVTTGVNAADEYQEILSEAGFGNLIPQKFEYPSHAGFCFGFGRNKYILESNEEIIDRCTFRISFVQAEKKIMNKIKNQQPGWFACYRLLKYFCERHALSMYNEKHFNEPKFDRVFGKQKRIVKFSSYVLKTLVLTKRIEIPDCDANNIAPKFMLVFDEIIAILKRYCDKPLELGYECVPSIWFEELSAMHTLIPETDENDRQREEEYQKAHTKRQLTRFESIKRLLLQINDDECYSYRKYRDLLIQECLNLHTDLLDVLFKNNTTE
ncbi:uncharacterized protein LOC123524891 isoform X2 [Mercenaria mercenaria]|uniref:uncharacterized protein LOC123524891 isoform X2 n=1 Tax=Mercenaria mercenaria TaxID=6596 RepID=UPI00234E505B|nr:uncharacterized protein LOC123524891 isoform X2 [Mercenaria mercenaria]